MTDLEGHRRLPRLESLKMRPALSYGQLVATPGLRGTVERCAIIMPVWS